LSACFQLCDASQSARKQALARCARQLDVYESNIEFLPHQPPKIKGSSLFCSSTHAAPYGAVAVAKKPVGIDMIAKQEKAVIPLRVLHGEEQLFLKNNQDFFPLLWAFKEAYFKAQFPHAPEPDTFCVTPYLITPAQQWNTIMLQKQTVSIWWQDVFTTHVLAVLTCVDNRRSV
jgi:phosphopantetheinyl transferase